MFAINPNKDWLSELAENYSGKIIIQFNGLPYTAADLIERRNYVCGILNRMKIDANDKVALISKNTINFVIDLFAVWAAGAIPVPINTRQSEDEIIKQLKFVNAKLVFTDFKKEQNKNIFKQFNVCINEEYKLGKRDYKSIDRQFSGSSTALLMFTSGSSGKPKCVELTFQNLIHSAGSVHKLLQTNKTYSWLASLPFYHIGGFSIIIRAILGGNKLVIPKTISFENIAAAITKGEASFISLVPTTLQRLLDAEIIPHKAIKAVFLGGGKVTLDSVKRALKMGYKLITVYGSTETSSMIAADKLSGKKISSSFAGLPLQNTEYFIVNENRTLLKADTIGEIAVKSPSIVKGYFNDLNETKNRFINYDNHNLKYYLTNDLGKIDEQGRLFITGRKDDIIISGGENISANEITAKIKTLSSIEDVFVFGMHDKYWGEKICAAVVLSATLNKKKNNLKNDLKNRLFKILPKYKIPKEIFFLKEIPRTSLGKISKTQLFLMIKDNTKI